MARWRRPRPWRRASARSGSRRRPSCTSVPRTPSVARRVAAMAKTELGDRRPAAGGHWLKTLRSLDGLRVWWAATAATEEYEDALPGRVRGRRPRGGPGGPARPRRRAPVGEPAPPDRRAEGDRAERRADPRTGRRRPRPPTRVVRVADGDAEGAHGEPPAPKRRPAAPRAPRAGEGARGQPRPWPRRLPRCVAGRSAHARRRGAAACRARRADPGQAPAGHRPHPDGQGARRPQGELRVPRRARGAVVPGGAGPGDRGAAAIGGHRRGAGRRLAGRARIGRHASTTTARPSPTRSSAPTKSTAARAGSRRRHRSGGPWSGGTRATTSYVDDAGGRAALPDPRRSSSAHGASRAFARARRPTPRQFLGGSTSLCSTA